jgi:hypothetical protein
MFLYLVRMYSKDESEVFFKVGVTHHEDIRNRFSFGTVAVKESALPFQEKVELLLKGQEYISDHPYEVEKVHSAWFKYEGVAREYEDALIEVLEESLLEYRPHIHFSGSTECFKGDEETKQLIIDFMNSAEEEARNNEPNHLLYEMASQRIKDDDPLSRHRKIMMEVKNLEDRSKAAD